MRDPVCLKDPDATLDYGFEWADWLATGETISQSSWTADDGISIVTWTAGQTSATVWLTGGTVGATYRVTNRITTSVGRTDERTMTIQVRNR